MVNNNILNFNTKCRSCLAQEQEMHHLFKEFDQGLTLSDILRSTTCFEIEDNDGLSSYLCEGCTRIVVEFFNFKTIYLENDNYIKSVYNEHNANNEIQHSNEMKDVKLEIQDINLEVQSSKAIINETPENTDEMPNVSDMEIDGLKQLEIIGKSIEHIETKQDSTEAQDSNLTNNVEFFKSIKYFCEECENCFLLKSDFQQHVLKKHHVSVFGFEKYGLNLSVQAQKTPKELEVNEKIVLQCETCKDNFNTYTEIEEHYKSHIKYVCEHCGAGFLKKSYLNDHAEIHTTEKRHVCPMCGKAFRRRTVLVKHKKIHTHPRQCICEICGLRFTDKGTLKTHIKLKHTKERNFNCTICGLWFPLKSTLIKHIYRHNDDREREHICNMCHMAYKDKSSLNRHIVIKHNEDIVKPSCTFCGKEYTTNTNLLKHIRRHHKSLQIKNTFDIIEVDLEPR